jgi:hypothetical protein
MWPPIDRQAKPLAVVCRVLDGLVSVCVRPPNARVAARGAQNRMLVHIRVA